MPTRRFAIVHIFSLASLDKSALSAHAMGCSANTGSCDWEGGPSPRGPASGNNPYDDGFYYAPPMSAQEIARGTVPFDEISERLKATLDEHGAAVVSGVIPTEEELMEFESDFAKDLQDLIDTESLETAPQEVRDAYERFLVEGLRAFPQRTAEKNLTAAAGFALYRCLAHGRFAWRVRRHPRVHQVFRTLYPGEDSDLVTSLDVPFFSPGGAATRTSKFSAHVDQNANDVRPGLADCEIYQGVLYIWPALGRSPMLEAGDRVESVPEAFIPKHKKDEPVAAGTQGIVKRVEGERIWVHWCGESSEHWSSPVELRIVEKGPESPGEVVTASTTVVWPGSHRSAWPQMMKDRSFQESGREGMHYCEIADMDNKKMARRLAAGWAQFARRCVIPGGGLLLWNSRTVHTGWRGGSRLAQAVCLQPAAYRPEKERISKMRLSAVGLPTVHWACMGMQHDMVLRSRGYFANQPVAARVDASGHVIFPLRSALHPVGLAEDADLEELEEFASVEFQYIGLWTPPDGSAEILEKCVSAEVKAYL